MNRADRMKRTSGWRLLLALPLLLASAGAHAALGIFEHGNGIKGQGAGGISYAYGEESTVLSANPALVNGLGTRFDIGTVFLHPMLIASFRGNAAGPDQDYENDGRTFLYIPQGGFTRSVNQRWAWGATMFSAGLGPDLRNSPYARYGSSPRVSFFLFNSGISLAAGYQLNDDHAFGFSLNLGYQQFSMHGLDFVDNAAFSQTPGKVTNQGKDGAWNVGFTVGWTGEVIEGLTLSLSYRSKQWTEKHQDYRGLLPEQGRLELPQIYGGGLAYQMLPSLVVAIDYQHYQYASEPGFGNRFSNATGLLGADDGPSFGLGNQDAYKLGLIWQASPAVVLRAGGVVASEISQASEQFFGMIASPNTTTHYTAGGTYGWRGWEVSANYAYAPRQLVKGRNSVPPALGGGEARGSFKSITWGLSLGRRFGGTAR